MSFRENAYQSKEIRQNPAYTTNKSTITKTWFSNLYHYHRPENNELGHTRVYP